jgi:hypothetical protein
LAILELKKCTFIKDVATELLIKCDGDEGLFKAYEILSLWSLFMQETI